MRVIVIVDHIQEIDVLRSIQATLNILPAGTVFTAQELQEGFTLARPQEEWEDIKLVQKILDATFSNAFMGSRWFLCDEIEDGHYRRR